MNRPWAGRAGEDGLRSIRDQELRPGPSEWKLAASWQRRARKGGLSWEAEPRGRVTALLPVSRSAPLVGVEDWR